MSISVLPKEIRLQIWALAYHDEAPRLVAFGPTGIQYPSQSPAPIVYNVCRESREETRFQARSLGHLIIVNTDPEADTDQKPKEKEKRPASCYEIICRYGKDVPFINDSASSPGALVFGQRETKGDAASHSDSILSYIDESNRKLITTVALQLPSSPAAIELWATAKSPSDKVVKLRNLSKIVFVARAFHCLGKEEKAKLARLPGMIIGDYMDILYWQRLVGGSMKRRNGNTNVEADLAILKKGALHVLKRWDWQHWEEADMKNRHAMFVKDIPEFTRAMERCAIASDSAASTDKA